VAPLAQRARVHPAPIAPAIALAAPTITHRASARLDRWVRERRAETYIDALAVLGRLAAFVSR
jgi:hypothetical protein